MKARDAAQGLLVCAATLFVLGLLTEAAMRAYTRHRLFYDVEMTRYARELKIESTNPRIGHVHAPGRESVLMGVRVKINSDGLRDREYPVARNRSRRLVFLGDSLTLGWGVDKPKTFEEIIESEMNKHEPVEILNFGVGNYNTEQETNLFLEKGLRYRPDEVVVFYFINDAEPTPVRSRWEFLGDSRAITFYWSRIKSLRSRFEDRLSFRDYYIGLYADDRPGWLTEKRSFLQLRDVCAENRITLRVVLLPELHVLREYPFADQHRKVLLFLRRNGIEALDLAPFFSQETNPGRLWVASDDAHPNELAHAMIARYALDFVAKTSHARKTNPEN